MTIREKVLSEINGFSVAKLYAVQGFINFLESENFEDVCLNEDPNGEPLDDFDYELAIRAESRRNRDRITFDEAIKEAGFTYADLQD